MGVAVPRTPWWLTWAMVGCLAVVFAGQRMLAAAGPSHIVVTGLGLMGLLTLTLWRFLSWRNATGGAKRVDRLLLLTYVGSLVAVVGAVASGDDALATIGLDFATHEGRDQFQVALQAASTILLVVSLLPALGAQWALTAHRHAGPESAAVELFRVEETAAGALTVAFAGAFLMLAGYVADARNRSVDFSYFKTARPGASTQQIVSGMSEPLRVLMFFPEVDEVKDEVAIYFGQLAETTHNVVIEEHERMVEARLAREHGVTSDATIILLRGDRTARLNLPTTLRSARARLRTLDREVQEPLLQLARDARAVYLTVGHGELNAPEPGDTVGTAGSPRSAEVVRQILGLLNFTVNDLGLQEGLGLEVPDNAAAVVVLGPRRPFLPEQLESLDRYLERGGALFLAIDPESDFLMGPLEQRLGVAYENIPLVDDRRYVRQLGSIADRQLIISDRFLAHEAIATASRTNVGSGIVLLGAGHFSDLPGNTNSRRHVIRSLESAFADLNGNFEFDEDGETRRAYNVAVAIEPQPDFSPDSVPVEPAEMVSTRPGGQFRALAYADAEMFSDGVLGSLALNASLVADGIRWLTGEESFAGAIASEEDVPIVHTNADDAAWFYSTIVGAPILILAAGLFSVFRRRRRAAA